MTTVETKHRKYIDGDRFGFMKFRGKIKIIVECFSFFLENFNIILKYENYIFMISLVVFKKTDCCTELLENCLLGAGVLGDGLLNLFDLRPLNTCNL